MLDYKYQKPIYDPFIEFQPTKSLIQEVIKENKHEAFNLREQIQSYPEWADWAKVELERRHRRLCARIRDYEYRLRVYGRNKGWQVSQRTNRINDHDIERAKGTLLTDLFSGQLKRSGTNKLIGRCPFHEEKSGSFLIYVDQNTFHCFGCGRNGDSIDYVMKRDNLDFIGAIKKLLETFQL